MILDGVGKVSQLVMEVNKEVWSEDVAQAQAHREESVGTFSKEQAPSPHVILGLCSELLTLTNLTLYFQIFPSFPGI